jgi:hypothetical protein
MTCNELEKILSSEIPALKSQIEKHKYYLSIKEKRDVGYDYAEKDFLKNHLNPWATGFRDCYCRFVCSNYTCLRED